MHEELVGMDQGCRPEALDLVGEIGCMTDTLTAAFAQEKLRLGGVSR